MVMTNACPYRGGLASLSGYILTFHNISYTLFLSCINDLSVGVLTYLQTSFVPPR
ncbi:transmembrane protein, putative [Medicago truncatula]|uniref:Transmembrane protein, putative n=1 Tax=Medicago truncatula TaxID=3880 RepID=G7IGY1_MEDTR|nr:transmembrane protein, putative [Medicago truncatula]